MATASKMTEDQRRLLYDLYSRLHSCLPPDERFNGILVNWYEANGEDYIVAHSDALGELVAKSPIATLSLGGSRIFRLRRRSPSPEETDISIHHGSLLGMHGETQLTHKREVPKPSKKMGPGDAFYQRRVSVAFRMMRS